MSSSAGNSAPNSPMAMLHIGSNPEREVSEELVSGCHQQSWCHALCSWDSWSNGGCKVLPSGSPGLRGRNSPALSRPQSEGETQPCPQWAPVQGGDIIPTSESSARERETEPHPGKPSIPAKPRPDRRYIKQSLWAAWLIGKRLGLGLEAWGTWTAHPLYGPVSFSPRRADRVRWVPRCLQVSGCSSAPSPPFPWRTLPKWTFLSFSLMSSTTLCVWTMSWASSILNLRCLIRYCWPRWGGCVRGEGQRSYLALSLERARDCVLSCRQELPPSDHVMRAQSSAEL